MDDDRNNSPDQRSTSPFRGPLEAMSHQDGPSDPRHAVVFGLLRRSSHDPESRGGWSALWEKAVSHGHEAARGASGSAEPEVAKSEKPSGKRPKRGRRGPGRVDADHYLRRLERDVAREARAKGGEASVSDKVLELRGLSSLQLAKMIQARFCVRLSDRTIRRNSHLYHVEWRPCRVGMRGSVKDPLQATKHLSEPADIQLSDAVSRHELRVVRGNGSGLRDNRTKEEIQRDKETDEWLREHGHASRDLGNG